MTHALSAYVLLGVPALLGTLRVLNGALDLYERVERRRSKGKRRRAP
jgi:hypothetical protein